MRDLLQAGSWHEHYLVLAKFSGRALELKLKPDRALRVSKDDETGL